MSAPGGMLTRFAFGRGLGRTLLMWFFFLAVAPLVVAGRLTYVSARNLLSESADQLLENALQLKGEHIQHYIEERVAAIKTQARYRSNLELLSLIASAQKDSGETLARFVRTPAWLDLAEDVGYDLHVLQQEEGYYDIMLLDTEGNVLFSILQEEELGGNVFHDAESPMGRAVRRALASKQPVCSDLQLHGLAEQRLVAFLVHVIADAEGNPAGLIAFGLPAEHLIRIMREGSRLGETGQTYIVGGDLLLRAPGRHHEGFEILQQRIETDVVLAWRQQHRQELEKFKAGGSSVVGSGQSTSEDLADGVKRRQVAVLRGGPLGIYRNYRGDMVRGRFQELSILADVGLDWAVFAEINASEAFRPAEKLHSLMMAVVIGTMAALLITAGGIVTYIVFPIRRLSSWARRVASGDLSDEAMAQPANEIGAVVQSFREVIDSFSSVAGVCEAVAVGELDKSVKVKGEKDVLARSVNLMAENLRGVVRQANRIASGDFSVEVRPRSKQDSLGLALEHMTSRLRIITEENSRALQEARRLVHNLDNLPSPVFTLDMQYNVTYINPAGAALAGLTPSECIGLKCQGLFRTVLCNTGDCCYEQIRRGGRTVSGKNILDAGEREIPVEYTAAPIRSAAGDIEGVLVHLNDITEREKAMDAMLQQEWFRNGQIRLSNIIRGVHSQEDLCQNVIVFLAEYLDAQAGVLYLAGEGKLTLAATHAFSEEVLQRSQVRFGEGLAGQVALTQKTLQLDQVPEGYFPIQSLLGRANPRSLLIVPLLADGVLLGVVELAGLVRFPTLYQDFLEQVAEYVAIALSAAQSRTRLTELLTETQEQAMLLQAQQEELRQANEELEFQTQALKASEEELQAQQEELRVTNEELEERTRALEEQQSRIRAKNEELETVRRGLERKTRDLEAASRYKSEFLANMSHELRTPLNSMLLLSGILAGNKEHNLSQKQMEYAATIHSAGTDLLKLINEILDLSKVESGKIILHQENVRIADFASGFEQSFREIASAKGLKFSIVLSEGLPETFRTDRLRAEQVIRNFLSNAFKFTEKGLVSLKFGRVDGGGAVPEGLLLGEVPNPALAISLADTGIGIPAEKQRVIFEEFRQADGTTTRKYGGTGLGLSISRRLGEVLGGAVHLISKEGEGSTFTLFLPLAEATSREDLRGLLVERSENKVVPVPVSGEQQSHPPPEDSVPARGELLLLIIESDPDLQSMLREVALNRQFHVITASAGHEGLELARQQRPEAIVLNMFLPDMDGATVVERLKEEKETRRIPVHAIAVRQPVSEGREGGISAGEPVAGPERIADEVSLFLHRVSAEKAPMAMTELRRAGVTALAGKKVLLVDDDMRNLFALTSILEDKGMRVVAAKNGREALTKLEENSDTALVLMDIMLPEVDGYEAMGEIRRQDRFRNLPIIALTAKAMKGDRAKCLEAGASDYMAKPVQSEKLLSLILVWLSR